MAEEVLIVTSKLKKYIKDKAGMNQNYSTIDTLRKLVRVFDTSVDKLIL